MLIGVKVIIINYLTNRLSTGYVDWLLDIWKDNRIGANLNFKYDLKPLSHDYLIFLFLTPKVQVITTGL